MNTEKRSCGLLMIHVLEMKIRDCSERCIFKSLALIYKREHLGNRKKGGKKKKKNLPNLLKEEKKSHCMLPGQNSKDILKTWMVVLTQESKFKNTMDRVFFFSFSA